MIIHNKTIIQVEFMWTEGGNVRERLPLGIDLNEWTEAEFIKAFQMLDGKRLEWEEKCLVQSVS